MTKCCCVNDCIALNSRHLAQPPLDFIPPNFKLWVLRLAYAALPILLKVRLRAWLPAGIQRVTVKNAETLAHLFHQFQNQKIRLLIAFRHVEVDDPLCMGYMFAHVIPNVAQQQNLELRKPIHSAFMYDRGMSLWAGAWLKDFFAWMGGIPVRRGRSMDLKAIKAARDTLMNGQFPLTIAPEGATNGHSERLSPLEPGVAQMAFWGVQDLRQQHRQEDVVVLPISIRYHYPTPNWTQLDRLLGQLEADCGLSIQSPIQQSSMQSSMQSSQDSLAVYYQRLVQIGQQMLAHTEQVYRRFYHVPLPEPITVNSQTDHSPTDHSQAGHSQAGHSQAGNSQVGQELQGDRGENEAIAHHLQPLLDQMLKVGEHYFGIPSQGDLPTRCRRLEEAGWTYIHREDLAITTRSQLGDAPAISPMEQGFANRIAAESYLNMEHMRLVESMVAVTGHYVKDNPSFERFAETALLLFDVMQRIKGVRVPRRPRLGWREAQITIGNPLSTAERWPTYAQSRKAGKQAIATLTDEIRQELERLIDQD